MTLYSSLRLSAAAFAVFGILACDRYELIKKGDSESSSTRTYFAEKQEVVVLEQKLTEMQAQVTALQARLSQASTQEISAGRYQLVVHPQNSRVSYLLDTKSGVTWTLRPDAQKREDVFTPIGFSGGFTVPALQNADGDLVLPEKEAEALKSIAEVHQYVKQVRAQDQETGDKEGINGAVDASLPSSAPETAGEETARAALSRSESSIAPKTTRRGASSEHRSKEKRYWRKDR